MELEGRAADAGQQTIRTQKRAANDPPAQSPPLHDQPSTIPRLTQLEADCVVAGSTSPCVPQTAAPGNRMLDIPASTMNHSRRPHVPVGDKSLRCATGFRSLHLHSRDMYGISRFRRSGTPGVTLCALDPVQSALPFEWPVPVKALVLSSLW